MSYKFNGYDWIELAECWGITVEPQVVDFAKNWDNATEDWTLPEKIDVTYTINGMKIVFTVEKAEEILAEKIKIHIKEELLRKDNELVRNDINNFLNELIKESKKEIGGDFNAPVYQGLLTVEDNHTFGQWIIRNLESLWS